jgi:hypothetical protein
VNLGRSFYGVQARLQNEPRPVGTNDTYGLNRPYGTRFLTVKSLQAVNDLPKLSRRYATSLQSAPA